MKIRSTILVAAVALALLLCPGATAQTLGNAWHIPDNATDLGGTFMRDPRFEIGTNTTVSIYNGNQFQGVGNPGNQTAGVLCYKNASGPGWSNTPMVWDRESGNNKFWRASFSTSGLPPNEPVLYYLMLLYSDHATTYVCGQDAGSMATTNLSTALTNAFSFRNRPAFLFHDNNRVINGSDVQVWLKAGYVGKDDSATSRWADRGAVYFTTDGTSPSGALGVASGTTHALPLQYDHRENDPSVAGNAMWWTGTLTNLPAFTTIRYRLSLWHSANSEEKFADYNAGTNNATFSFTLGTVGAPVLTVNGLNADYTTSHLFVDEVAGDAVPVTISFQPNVPSIIAVEAFSNLNRRDRAGLDANGDGIEDGIVAPDGNLLTTNDLNHYYRAYPMSSSGGTTYTLTLQATQCGAYRLTARYKVSGSTNWVWYSSSGRRDHALVVSPRKVRDLVMYELNTLNVAATGTLEEQRSTFVDLWDGPGATLTSRWNLDYVKNLGANCLWFQPIHPAGIDGRQTDPATGQPFEIGSPYAVKNFFEVMPQMSKANTRAAAMQEFTNFVAAADAKGINVMLDAAFNHTAYDCELAARGVAYFGGTSPTQEIRNVEARFYSLNGNYCSRAYDASSIAVAPDRGDFGKFTDVHDVFFGRYAALVCQNPADNGNHLNEGDWLDTTPGTGSFDAVTRNVWRYFADYILFWLDQTGCPSGTPLSQTWRGLDGLRADFGQGLPPQAWEYIINRTRARKWDFLFMAESLDGGAVTYRSNRHFDILNENILFALKGASVADDYRAIYEQRRASYGQAPVLLNTTSHDEENYAEPWEALIRHACNAAIDGVPMIFYGQELGLRTLTGFDRYELNFGKQIPHFKKFNSLTPVWKNNDFGLRQLNPVFAALHRARLSSPALRGPTRYFLSPKGAANPKLFAVAKYTASDPANGDVVFAFANLDRNNPQAGTFEVNVDGGSSNLFGLHAAQLYNVRNLAAYTAQDAGRSSRFLWTTPRTGADVLANGLYVALNPVPTTDAGWSNAPYEAQYLKLLNVTPPLAPGTPTPPKRYALTNAAVFTWTASGPNEVSVTNYALTVGTAPGGSNVFNGPAGTNLTLTVTGAFGQTLFASVRAINALGLDSPTASSTNGVTLLRPNDDEDHDGLTNAQEDIAGTDPFDPASVLRITRLGRADRRIEWLSVAGHSYQVFATTNLSQPFQPLSPLLTPGTGLGAYTDTNSAGPERFYRIKVQPSM